MQPSGTRRLVGAWGATVLVAASVHAQSTTRYTDAKPSDRGAPARAVAPSLPVTQGSLTFYTDRSVFDGAHPGLPVEDFAATLVPPNSIVACTGPFDNATSNACFASGGIRPGISVVNTNGGSLVVLTPPVLGVPCVSVGPQVLEESGELQFDPPVEAVGLDLESTFAVPFTVTVFGPGGSLGGTTHSGAIPGAFLGVDTSDADGISRVTFSAAGANGELFCNVAFGQPVPVELLSFTIQ